MVWRQLDSEILLTPMPEEYQDKMVGSQTQVLQTPTVVFAPTVQKKGYSIIVGYFVYNHTNFVQSVSVFVC